MLLRAEFLPSINFLKFKAFKLTLCGLLLTLGACSSQQPQPPVSGAELPIAQLQNWSIKGKLGVRAPRENGSANLLWDQTAQTYRIHLSGPLGAGATVINGTPAGVTLQRGSEPAVHAANPTELTETTLGWPLPVAEMSYWVRGIPAPGASANPSRNAQGQLQSLQQAGWQLNFSGYQNVGRYLLPTRIKASTRQAAGPVNVTLVIKEWLPQ